jgi:putative lipoic acid-binding regulatory protein
MEENDSLLKFPCEFPIKAMGRTGEDFDSLVVGLVRKHHPDLLEGSVKIRLSNGGRYMAVTITINARSRDQLDDIYRELTSDERVLMAL